MLETSEGIVLKTTPYNDNSVIMQVLTKKRGLISLIAHNAKSIKSNLRIISQKFAYAIFNYYYKENKISKLVSGEIIDNFNNIKNDIVLISYLTYICDLTYQVVKTTNDNFIYSYIISSIKKIEEGLDPLTITNILEIKYLKYLGINLNLDECIKCHNQKDIVTISSKEGGYICKNCLQNEFIVNPKTIKLLREYYYVDIESINKININFQIKKEINNFLDEYYDTYTGLYLKSKEFLNKIVNMS